MKSVYIIYQQWYDEIYIYGVFSSKNSLDDALDSLAIHPTHLDVARKSRKDQIGRWEVRKSHFPNQEPPYCMTIPLFEYSRSRFDVKKVNLDSLIFEPNIIWYEVTE